MDEIVDCLSRMSVEGRSHFLQLTGADLAKVQAALAERTGASDRALVVAPARAEQGSAPIVASAMGEQGSSSTAIVAAQSFSALATQLRETALAGSEDTDTNKKMAGLPLIALFFVMILLNESIGVMATNERATRATERVMGLHRDAFKMDKSASAKRSEARKQASAPLRALLGMPKSTLVKHDGETADAAAARIVDEHLSEYKKVSATTTHLPHSRDM